MFDAAFAELAMQMRHDHQHHHGQWMSVPIHDHPLGYVLEMQSAPTSWEGCVMLCVFAPNGLIYLAYHVAAFSSMMCEWIAD